MTPHFSPEPGSPAAQPFTPSPHRVPDLRGAPILLVGPGAMGSAIAERAALAGHPVLWRDGRDGIAAAAKARLAHRLAAQVGRGERDAGAVAEALARIEPITDLGRASGVRLVIEAVVEHAEIKRGLLRNLEDWVGADCVFATTTATLSISMLASGLRQPPRLAGLHFGLPALAEASGSTGFPPT
ncbi:MAG: 3-hydroxyacyl-CoA dehydrogenase family protein, partial [Leptothrix sp. (in: b-proteobacteria)]